jgi:Transposase DDE domain group 1
MNEATLFLPGLSLIGGKEITATFDGGQLSSDGGVLILREIEKRLGIATMLSRHVPDLRDPGRIVHTYDSMIQARVFAIASGWRRPRPRGAPSARDRRRLAAGKVE